MGITTIGIATYVVVTGTNDDGIRILDISVPSSQVSVIELKAGTDTGVCTAANGERCLDGPIDVEIATIGSSTYAVVAGSLDDGIEIIDISDPTSPSSTGRITDRDDSTRELEGATGVAITTIGSST